MGARGRLSIASQTVTEVCVESRARPPSDLTQEQSQEWLAIVGRMPGGWFERETHAVLAQYCRHVVAARRVAQLILAAESDAELDVNEYDRLLKMQEREGRAISALATRMRLTQQATYDKTKSKGRARAKPWQSES